MRFPEAVSKIEEAPMKLRLKAFLGAFGLTIVAAIVGNILESQGYLTEERLGQQGVKALMAFFFGLFCLICLTIVPLAIRLFIRGQVSIGNGDLPPIRWLRVHENAAVFAAWGFFFLGLAIIWALAREDILNEFL